MLDGRQGDLGLMAYLMKPGHAISTNNIATFFEQHLSAQLNAFPGPRSVVILDNAPGHRALAANVQFRIVTSVQRRGALLIWIPPHSPDLNPIEHIWSVSKRLAARRLVALMTGQLGIPRPFAQGDLTWCLQTARLSRDAYDAIFTQQS